MNKPYPTQAHARRVAVAGASGLVGGFLLKGLMADDTVSEVHVLARRPLPVPAGKVSLHVVDFRALPPLPAIDEVYLALGTTIRVAGSKEAFKAVDLDANLAVAQAALRAGARRLGLVSAMGANARSSVFYNRVKGELEEALQALATESLVIARPSLLLGDRSVLGQPTRTGEHLAQRLLGPLGWLLPRNLRPIHAAKVAQSLLRKVPATQGTLVLPSAELQAFS
jgi:uncharacterized protein YbjT (DUF2867 family)